MSSAFNRVIVLVDMDCFYVQVEQRRDPSLKGKPCAVVQYKPWKGGGIIAIGYEARALGVSRGMHGDDAKEKCPEIVLCRVPEANGKANLDRYREAGAEVINVLSQFGGRVERASIDEAYIDLTEVVNKIIEKQDRDFLDPDKLPNTHVVGWPAKMDDNYDKIEARMKGLKNWLNRIKTDAKYINDVKLSIAGQITEDVRAAVYHQTGFRCSAGISHNKILAKLACGINKPNKQTILPCDSITGLFETIKVGKIRHLGGKLGNSLVRNFGIQYIGEVNNIALDKLVIAYGHKTAYWLHEVCKGIDHEHVKERHIAQSIGCGKNFLGKEALNMKEKVMRWINSLMIELSERLEKDKAANSRVARTLSVHVKLETGQSLSRSGPLLKYGREDLAQQCIQLIRALNTRSSRELQWTPAIISMSMNAKNFDSIGSRGSSMLKHISPTRNKQSIMESVSSSSGSTQKITNPKSEKSSFLSRYFKNDGKTNHADSCDDYTKAKPIGQLENQEDGGLCSAVLESKHPVKPESSCKMMSSENDVIILGSQISKKPRKSFFEPSQSHTSNKSCSDNDVIVVDSQEPIKAKNSFFELTQSQNSTNQSVPCLIDQAFMREKRRSEGSTSMNFEPVRKGSINHPVYGEIDMEVYENLPPDIRKEISKSYQISMETIPSSSQQKKQISQSRQKSTEKQRLIHNFMPKTQSLPCQNENIESPSPNYKAKRPNADPIPDNIVKKIKTSKKSPIAKTKVVKPMSKIDSFANQKKQDVVPLGFFRQRSQLSNAISKALMKQQTNKKS